VTVGASFDPNRLHDRDFALDPWPVWRELRDRHPVYFDPIDRVYLVTRHEDVLRGFTDTEVLSNRLYRKTLGAVFGPNLLQLDGRDHVQRRTIVAPLFMGNRLAAYRPLIEATAERLVGAFAPDGRVELISQLTSRLPGEVIVTLLGLPEQDRQQMHDWYEAMMAGLWTDPELRRLGREAHQALAAHVRPFLAERRRCPVDDLMSRLVAAEVDGTGLSQSELEAFVSLLLTAGGETTDKAIANLWYLLLTHPQTLDEVRADPELLHAAFTETMRHSPSLVYQAREATREFEWHGVTVPAGAEVRLCHASANHDERVFADPERWDVHRVDLNLGKERRSGATVAGRASHLAFGAGPHFCLGYELARAETVTVSQVLLDVLRHPRLAPDVPTRQRVVGPTLAPPHLTIEFEPRRTA
jgi:pulcherriminic acid synthase